MSTHLPNQAYDELAPDALAAQLAASFRLDGQVVILTGASSGIGWRFAHVLHAAGASVVMGARRKDRLEQLEADLPGSMAIACDVAEDSDVEALVDATMERFGRIDVLVNNAGASGPMPAEDEPMDAFRRIVAVNLTGAFLCCKLVGRHMLARQSGSIINVASVLGLIGGGQIPQASYTASKGGLANLTRELAAQWSRRGVRVNAIAPGWFPTEMTDEMFADEGGRRWIRRKTPMGRAGDITELDGVLLFLAGTASSYITGQVLPVDGGWTAV
ncbi:MAG: SDR family NAD(P)-dependent oxidoreductase [Acidimicrobiales bacterium]